MNHSYFLKNNYKTLPIPQAVSVPKFENNVALLIKNFLSNGLDIFLIQYKQFTYKIPAKYPTNTS